MTTFEGNMTAKAGRYAVACSRFNDLIVDRLLHGATDALTRHGVAPDDIDIAWAPGAWELPIVAQRLARSGSYVAVIGPSPIRGHIVITETSPDRSPRPVSTTITDA